MIPNTAATLTVPRFEDLQLHQWAWEFLRRSDEYNEFWAEICSDWNKHLNAFSRASAFWLWFPLDPSIPGHRFQTWWWNANHVAFPGSEKIYYGREEGEPATVFFPRHGISREAQIAAFAKVLDEQGVQPKGRTGRPLLAYNFPLCLLTYDLKKETDATFEKIGLHLHPRYAPEDAKSKAKGYYDTARDLVTGGYRKILQADNITDTPEVWRSA